MKTRLFLLMCLSLLACGGPEPRRPVEVRSGSFLKESVARNKELLAREEAQILEQIRQDSLREYQPSAAGSWYAYITRNEEAAYTPSPGDLVTLNYALLSLENDTIYSAADIGNVEYLVDKEEMFPGLRNSVKLLKEGESAAFLFPSSLGYGYHGDDRKIGPNVPLKAIITLLTIEKQQDKNQN